ncbi:MAG: long-chain fatty acid--CoA ligase [Bradymonadales bacterium]|jgi:long-chain acyl-CoA synthetase
MKPYYTLAELLKYTCNKYPNYPAFGTKVGGSYQWVSFADFEIKVRRLRSALKSIGLEKGDRVALIANNSVEWATVAYACYGLGAILVPMYEVQKSQDWEYIINNSGSKVLFTANENILAQCSELAVLTLEYSFSFKVDNILSPQSYERLLNNEQGLLDVQDVKEDDLADIIYTSGTTGLPKGVMLTHKNIVTNCLSVQSLFELGPSDCILSFLPWAHAFGKTVELHTFISTGTAVGIAESRRTIAQNMLEVNPTILNGVPKIFNTIYDNIHLNVKNGSWLSKTMFETYAKLATKRRQDSLSFTEKAQYSALDKVVGKKIRGIFGNRIRFCVSGGAALSKEVAEFFDSFGIPVYEGYGLTECAPIIAVNSPSSIKYGSAGRIMPNVSVRIDQSVGDEENYGEIITSGDCVMKGYFEEPQADAEVFTDTREFRTGDMGRLDDDGFLWITGRVKEQYKLENGKYVVPSALEKQIVTSPFIENAIVFGNARPYNVVIVQPNAEFVSKFKAENALNDASQEEIENNSKLRDIVSAEIQSATKDFRGYERPQKFAITLDDFSIQNNMFSPTLKIKRHVAEKVYAEVIESLYRS